MRKEQLERIKELAITGVIRREGSEFTDDPLDSGGATKYGITERVARAYGYKGQMKDLDEKTAISIYDKAYWQKQKLDDICSKSASIAEELFDTSVNMGLYFAGISLQRVLNAMNNKGQYWDDLKVDGIIGSKTIKAYNAYMLLRIEQQGIRVMLDALNGLQIARYIELAEKREKDETFVYGWILNRAYVGVKVDIEI